MGGDGRGWAFLVRVFRGSKGLLPVWGGDCWGINFMHVGYEGKMVVVVARQAELLRGPVLFGMFVRIVGSKLPEAEASGML